MTETKTRLDALIRASRSASATTSRRSGSQLDGCPHACAHHWVGDLGFQGTTARDEEGKRRQAYDVFLRGALGPAAAIGRPVFRRVPTEELDAAVEGLVARLARAAPRRGRDLPRFLRPADRRRARRPRRPRARPTREREGRG